jgi:cellulose synthase/poly-beta-1,6-N-acetylglucosamine synthase-like glycosyltransferase
MSETRSYTKRHAGFLPLYGVFPLFSFLFLYFFFFLSFLLPSINNTITTFTYTSISQEQVKTLAPIWLQTPLASYHAYVGISAQRFGSLSVVKAFVAIARSPKFTTINLCELSDADMQLPNPT